MSGKNFIFTVVLGKYQGKEYPLKTDQETVIGRTNEADIVFAETMVSRKHAKVVVEGDDVVLQDLGSTNGTFVDGNRITRAKVKPGDLILIGSNMINLALQNGTNGELGSNGAARKVNGSASMSGLLDQIPLTDLIQLLSTSRKSGVLNVTHEDEVGRFYIKDGKIEYALIEECPKMAPKKALYRMMLWNQGTFELHPPSDETFETKITDPVDILLLEAMQHQDEHSRLPKEKPELNTVLALPNPLDKPLHTLSPNHLNMIQLIINYGKVRRILYHSPLSDYETYRIMAELIKDGYVTKTSDQ